MIASMRPASASFLGRATTPSGEFPPVVRTSHPPAALETTDRRDVLFVSDAGESLNLAQRRIAEQMLPWNAEFAREAFEALGLLEQRRFDAIVVDDRLEGLGATSLLRRARREHPSVARILIGDATGARLGPNATPVLFDVAIPIEHAALDLAIAVDRAHGFRAMVNEPRLATLIDSLETAKHPPETFVALARTFADPHATLKAAADVVASDARLSTRVLRYANSAQVGMASRIVSVEQAIRIVGLETVQCLALSMPFQVEGEAPRIEGYSSERVQRVSSSSAHVARRFATESWTAEDAFVGAFLHEVGVMALLASAPNALRAVARARRSTRGTRDEAEVATLGATTAVVGAAIVDRWGFPLWVAEAVAHHRQPGRIWDGPCEVLAAVHAAVAFVEAEIDRRVGSEPVPALDRAFLHRSGFGERIESWRRIAATEWNALQNARRSDGPRGFRY